MKPHFSFLEGKVLEILRQRKRTGGTCDEVRLALGASHQTVSSRLSALFARGEVVRNGLTRETTYGRKAKVNYLPRFLK